MACGVCEHCLGPVSRDESVSFRGGYSYHRSCDKCYVCSETDLTNAEIFKGVIFCSSCSQRIFQGCSRARQTKVTRPKRSRSRRKVHRTKVKREKTTGVIELAGLVASSGTDKSSSDRNKNSKCKTLAVSTDRASEAGNELTYKNTYELKKPSVDMGTTTNVTQVLLSQIESPEYRQPSPIERQSFRQNETHGKITCSDLRIAELGASTEMANMALRKKSELPVIIKSESRLQREESISLSMLKQESDVSGDVNEEWVGSNYSTLRNTAVRPLADRHVGSLLRLPYKYFKKNILERSSLISVLMTSSGSKEEQVRTMEKLKLFFHEEITEHQSRGIRKLYPTINRRKTPYKMGWLNLMMKISKTIEPTTSKPEHKSCKHFRRSHSYRCMRAKIMRLAGPTKSELAAFRARVKTTVAPNFVRNLLTYNKRYALMMSRACGSDAHHSELLKQPLNIVR